MDALRWAGWHPIATTCLVDCCCCKHTSSRQDCLCWSCGLCTCLPLCLLHARWFKLAMSPSKSEAPCQLDADMPLLPALAHSQTIWCFENMQQLQKVFDAAGPQPPAACVLCKPNKRAFEAVLQQLGLEASKVVFIDDSPRNCAAAHEVGIFSVLVSDRGKVAGIVGLRVGRRGCFSQGPADPAALLLLYRVSAACPAPLPTIPQSDPFW